MLKNVTLSAEKELIDQARKLAEAENTTLNAEFRRWLFSFVQHKKGTTNLKTTMDKMRYVLPGKSFTRDEMNDR